ncbi:MAG: hypothetical protein CMC40_00680 [Flavobacteriaceae bacterium]|jgi:hypothetical protein|nr:hypothetical protein [Flavobacteriaceae bacterium]|tara:strand:- start:142 stop:324 length:183 start_codon:yes stop_codon:yes gene_type:complete
MISYIIENKEELIAIATAVVTAASLISAMTPNKADNKITGILLKLINWLALNVGKAKPKA